MKETVLSKITKGPEKDGYQPLAFETQRGEIKARYYKAPSPKAGMIWVGGIGGDIDTPANGLYPRLSRLLTDAGLSSLRVQFRLGTG